MENGVGKFLLPKLKNTQQSNKLKGAKKYGKNNKNYIREEK